MEGVVGGGGVTMNSLGEVDFKMEGEEEVVIISEVVLFLLEIFSKCNN